MKEFWFVTRDHSVYGVELGEQEAQLVSLGGALLEDCVVTTLAADGLHGKAAGQVFQVAGLFLDQEAAIKAADTPKDR